MRMKRGDRENDTNDDTAMCEYKTLRRFEIRL